ncbi:hypothetical protein LSPH26S_03832 [Lysinibacillus sphaericus]
MRVGGERRQLEAVLADRIGVGRRLLAVGRQRGGAEPRQQQGGHQSERQGFAHQGCTFRREGRSLNARRAGRRAGRHGWWAGTSAESGQCHVRGDRRRHAFHVSNASSRDCSDCRVAGSISQPSASKRSAARATYQSQHQHRQHAAGVQRLASRPAPAGCPTARCWRRVRRRACPPAPRRAGFRARASPTRSSARQAPPPLCPGRGDEQAIGGGDRFTHQYTGRCGQFRSSNSGTEASAVWTSSAGCPVPGPWRREADGGSMRRGAGCRQRTARGGRIIGAVIARSPEAWGSRFDQQQRGAGDQQRTHGDVDAAADRGKRQPTRQPGAEHGPQQQTRGGNQREQADQRQVVAGPVAGIAASTVSTSTQLFGLRNWKPTRPSVPAGKLGDAAAGLAANPAATSESPSQTRYAAPIVPTARRSGGYAQRGCRTQRRDGQQQQPAADAVDDGRQRAAQAGVSGGAQNTTRLFGPGVMAATPSRPAAASS